MTHLEEPVDIIVLLVRSTRIPEHALVRVAVDDGETLGLYPAPGEAVDGAAGAVVHGDGGGGGGGGGQPPGHHTHQVDADVYRHHVGSAVAPGVSNDNSAASSRFINILFT